MKNRLWTALIVVSGLGTWQVLVSVRLADPFYVSSPLLILRKMGEWLGTREIFVDTFLTLSEVLVGLSLGMVAGFAVALSLARSAALRRAVVPLLSALNALPRPALAPLIILWFGIGFVSKALVAFSAAFFVFAFNVLDAIVNVDATLVRHARLLGAQGTSIVRHVYLPATGSALAANLRLGLGFAMIGAIVGEFIASSAGLGYRILVAQSYFDTTGVMATLVWILLIVAILNNLAHTVEVRCARWRHP